MIHINFKFMSKISRKWLGIIALSICIMAGVCYLLTRQTSHPSTDVSAIDTRLDDIQSRVMMLQNEIKKPAEKIDSLAGWTVIAIDFGKQQLEFENTHKERVLVNLTIIQDEQHA